MKFALLLKRLGLTSTLMDSLGDARGPLQSPCKESGPCRDRTCDLGIKSPLLYQLS
jgi:hypothetical protein